MASHGKATRGLGHTTWVIPEGYIPSDEVPRSHAMQSHEAACILNTGDRPAHVDVTLYFPDRPPVGPYQLTIPARRTLHLRFNDLKEPAPVPRDQDYASVLHADVPIVVQHTRLDARQPAHAVLTTMAFPVS